MRKLIVILIVLSSVSFAQRISNGTAWRGGYLPSWDLNVSGIKNGKNDHTAGRPVKYTSIHYAAFTQIHLFTVGMNSDGTIPVFKYSNGDICWGDENLTSAQRKPLNDYIHESTSCKAMITIFSNGDGGWFAACTGNSAYRTQLVKTIRDSLILANKYDGIDFDMEPMNVADTANYRLFFRELRDTLERYHQTADPTKHPIVAVVINNNHVWWSTKMIGLLDQVNVMTYDYMGLWLETMWHNNAVLTAGATNPYGGALPSMQLVARFMINAGANPGLIGIGLSTSAYGFKGGKLSTDINQGCIRPRDRWYGGGFPSANAPTKISWKEMRYRDFKQAYLDTGAAWIKFDAASAVPYYSYDGPGWANDQYWTYSDTNTMRAAIVTADTMNLGGIIFWEIGGSTVYTGKDKHPHTTTMLNTIRELQSDSPMNRSKTVK